jgi:hypothetical protein
MIPFTAVAGTEVPVGLDRLYDSIVIHNFQREHNCKLYVKFCNAPAGDHVLIQSGNDKPNLTGRDYIVLDLFLSVDGRFSSQDANNSHTAVL